MKGKEAVDLLSRYLQIDTSNPPGGEAAAAAFFAAIFEEEGVEYTIYEPAPGRQSIRAVIPGSGKKGAMILLNHTDVVPAEAAEWARDPFGGIVDDGFIHGRGAIDMKGQGIMELMAFLDVARNGVRLQGDLVFLAAADEECGGTHGVSYLLANHPDEFKADLVINEGGLGVGGLLPDRIAMMVATAEKGHCWLRLTKTGPSGHASSPHGENALELLNKALYHLFCEDEPWTITPLISDYFLKMAEGWDFLSPFAEDRDPETLIRLLSQSGLLAIPKLAAMVKNTISLTVMRAGVKTNVIPNRAEAELDVRILPGQSVETVVERIRARLQDPDISVDILDAHEPTASASEGAAFRQIEAVLRQSFPGCVVVPSLLIGTSDSRFFRRCGIPVFGICPAVMNMSEIDTIHGVDERISVENVVNGAGVYSKIIQVFLGNGA